MLARYPTRRSWIVGAFVIAAVMAATRFAVNDTATATEQATAITKTEQLRDNLQKALDAAEAQLKPLRANVQALPGQAEKSLREKLDDARRQLEAQKGRVNRTRANLKARAEQKLTETKEAVSEWKAKREIRKLNARAERAEAYAADAIDFAAAAITQAEEAVLEAAVARIDADLPRNRPNRARPEAAQSRFFPPGHRPDAPAFGPG